MNLIWIWEFVQLGQAIIVKPPDLCLKGGDFAFHSGLTQL